MKSARESPRRVRGRQAARNYSDGGIPSVDTRQKSGTFDGAEKYFDKARLLVLQKISPFANPPVLNFMKTPAAPHRIYDRLIAVARNFERGALSINQERVPASLRAARARDDAVRQRQRRRPSHSSLFPRVCKRMVLARDRCGSEIPRGRCTPHNAGRSMATRVKAPAIPFPLAAPPQIKGRDATPARSAYVDVT